MESDIWVLDGSLGSTFTYIYTRAKERHLHFSVCSMWTWYSRAWTRRSESCGDVEPVPQGPKAVD